MYRLAFAAAAATLVPAAVAAQTAPTPAAPAAAPAPASAAPTVGATVVDSTGAAVGTIASIDGPNAVIDTGTVKAGVPLGSLGTGPKGPVLGMTKAQLEAAAGQAAAQQGDDVKAKLVAGTAVYGSGGAQLGTIKQADAQFVTVTTPKGDAKLPVAGFGSAPQGVSIAMTQAQFEAAITGGGQ